MKIKHLLFALVSFIVLGTSCKKEDKKSKTELLTAGSWKIKALIVKSGATTVDLFALQDDCDKDNLYTFKTDNTLIIDEGAIKCGEDQTFTSSWSFSDNETKIVMEGESGSIVSLTSSEFKISSSETEGDVTYTYEATFGR